MNTLKILKDFKINFIESHPEVSKSCVGIDCPFCGDIGKHLGIFREHGNYYCWKCGSKGSLFRLLHILKGISWEEYLDKLDISYKGMGTSVKETLTAIFKKHSKRKESVEITRQEHKEFKETWKELSIVQNKLILRFLNKRQLNYNDLQYYGAKIAISGKFIHRLIIPIPAPFIGNDECFIARDLTGQAIKKYVVESDINIHQIPYYNFPLDMPYKELVITEGIFDVWAIKNYFATCLFGKVLSLHQFNSVVAMNDHIKTIIIALDGDAKKDTLKLKAQLKPFFEEVKTLYLPEKEDPSSLGTIKIEKLIKGILHEIKKENTL
jgi:DNA primase